MQAARPSPILRICMGPAVAGHAALRTQPAQRSAPHCARHGSQTGQARAHESSMARWSVRNSKSTIGHLRRTERLAELRCNFAVISHLDCIAAETVNSSQPVRPALLRDAIIVNPATALDHVTSSIRLAMHLQHLAEHRVLEGVFKHLHATRQNGLQWDDIFATKLSCRFVSNIRMLVCSSGQATLWVF